MERPCSCPLFMNSPQMPNNSQFSNVGINSQAASSSHAALTSLNSSPGTTAYCPSTSSAMSAAAAAAFLLQAATGGPVNGDSSSGTISRRNSTSAFKESSQSPLSFHPSVISAAAHQAALAAAQAMGSSSRTSSELHAAVMSLALAANPPVATQSHPYLYNQSEKVSRSSQSVSELLLFPERHPELLEPNSSLASVLRRRSSTVLPSSFSGAMSSDPSLDTSEKPNDDAVSSCSQNFISAFELLNSKRHGLHPEATTPLSTELGHHDNLTSNSHLRSNRLSQTDYPTVGMDRGFSRCNRLVSSSCESSGPFLSTSHPDHLVSSVGAADSSVRASGIFGTQSLSPTAASSLNDGTLAHCQSASPMSYSSDNAAMPSLNISPLPIDDRYRSVADPNVRDISTKFGAHNRSTRITSSQLQDVKSEYSYHADYKDDSNRKREQRLLKNREAARECRRKKKEYVKCLETRVSILESQNQQLIEELQKVKALCFNELCGIGLTNSTAVCAAAVLAAATSISGTSSIPGVTFASTNSNFSSHSGPQLSERNFSHTHTHSSEDSHQLVDAFNFTSRIRPRRRSVVHSVRSHDSGPSQTQFAPYTGQYPLKLDAENGHVPSFASEVALKLNNSQPLRIDSASGASNLYDSVVSSGGGDSGIDVEACRPTSCGAGTPQAYTDIPKPGSKRMDTDTSYVFSTEGPSETDHSFVHPHHTTKRPYRSIQHEDKQDVEATHPDRSDHASEPKSKPSVPANDAAVILAAAAAIVAESDAKSGSH